MEAGRFGSRCNVARTATRCRLHLSVALNQRGLSVEGPGVGVMRSAGAFGRGGSGDVLGQQPAAGGWGHGGNWIHATGMLTCALLRCLSPLLSV